jgi:hypothetical protein
MLYWWFFRTMGKSVIGHEGQVSQRTMVLVMVETSPKMV